MKTTTSLQSLIAIPLALLSSSAASAEWVELPNYDLARLYYEDADGAPTARAVRIVGTTGHAWPDGSQASIVYLEVSQRHRKWLYRCTEPLTRDLQPLNGRCYELRK